MAIIPYLLIFIAGASKGIMDTLQFHFDKSIFKNFNPSFWNPSISWVNKWKNSDAKKEAFPLSSSLLSFLTDAWHFFQSIFFTCIFTAMVLYIKPSDHYYFSHSVNIVIDFITLRCVFGIGFVLFYNYLLVKK